MNAFLLFSSLLWCGSIFSIIVKTDDVSIITKELIPNSLVVFDIDNTLAHPEGVPEGNPLGSDQWFVYLYKNRMNDGLSINQAIKDVLPLYCHIQSKTTLVPVDESMLGFIEKLQTMPTIDVIALTARSFPLITRTIEQLDQMGVDFAESSPFCHNVALDLPHPALCRHGVIFSGMNDKGETLYAFAKASDHLPSKVIAIDDKEKNLRSIERACEEHAIPFFGIHYSGADKYVDEFNANLAEKYVHEFLSPYLNNSEQSSNGFCNKIIHGLSCWFFSLYS